MIISVPVAMRLARKSSRFFLLLCEHWRWMTALGHAKVPTVITLKFGEHTSGAPNWGDLLWACFFEGAGQLALFATHNLTEMLLCIAAITQTVSLVQTLLRRSARRRLRRVNARAGSRP